MAHDHAAPKARLSARDRTLRWITLLNFVPGFSLLIAHRVVTHEPMPSLTLIPMGISVIQAVILLSNFRLTWPLDLVVEPLICGAYFGLLLPSWIIITERTHRRWGPVGEPILATYGTVPAMVNFGIHLFFLLQQFHHVLAALFTRLAHYQWLSPAVCPHCDGDLQVPSRRAVAPRGSRSGDDHNSLYSDDSKQQSAAYRDVIGQENLDGPQPEMAGTEPRPSTDDETARLV